MYQNGNIWLEVNGKWESGFKYIPKVTLLLKITFLLFKVKINTVLLKLHLTASYCGSLLSVLVALIEVAWIQGG